MALLVVDDEPLNRKLFSRMLGSQFEVLTAESGMAALDLMASEADKVQLIVCDQTMPGMKGTELAAIVNRQWPQVRFCLLTGSHQTQEMDRGLSVGEIDRVLLKPCPKKVLAQEIESLLGSRAGSD